MEFLRLVRVEWVKTMRMRSTYIAFVVAGILVMTVQLGVYFNADESPFYRFLEANGFDTSLLVNAFIGTRLAMEVGFGLLMAPMIILTFARQVAGEDLRGTLRLMLVRPIGRLDLLLAKFLVCSLYVGLLMGFFLGLSYGMGIVLYGPKDSITVARPWEVEPETGSGEAGGAAGPPNQRWEEMTEAERAQARATRRGRRDRRFQTIARYVITPGQGLKRLLIAWPLTSWALLTVGSIAFFFSVINKHPIAAMALTVGTYFMVMILQGLASQSNIIPLFQWIQPYLFTTAMDFWRGCFSVEIEWGSVGRHAALLGGYTLGFFALAQWIFWRKDITS